MSNDPNNGSKNPNNNHDKYKNLYHCVYVAGYIIVTAPIEFVFLWPDTHLGALLGMAALLSLPTIYEMTVWGFRPITTTATVIIWFVAAGMTFWTIGPIPLSESEAHGWLLPANDPTPSLYCTRKQIPAAAIVFLLGTNSIATLDTTIDILKVGQCHAVWMRRVGPGIFINADLFAPNGDLMVRIRDNEFHLVSGEYSYRDRSDDRSTIAVYDKKGNEAFYTRFINPRTVVIRGVFSCGSTRVQLIIKNDNIFETQRDNTLKDNCIGGMPAGIWADDRGVVYLGAWPPSRRKK
jgi:hypothetical protein